MTIGEKIKKARKDKGMTQVQLAMCLGVKSAAISKYEKELVSPSWETISRIAEALNITTTELLADVEPWAEIPSISEFDISSIREDAIKKFDMLNKIGREKAYEYIIDLTENSKYIVPDEE